MSTFQKFTEEIQKRFNEMCATGKLFRSVITGEAVWDLYLGGFSKEDDPMFRDPDSTTHNCNHCNNFIRRYGNIVAVAEDNTLMSMFDDISIDEYAPSAAIISDALLNNKIGSLFVETYNGLVSMNYKTGSKSSATFHFGIDKNSKRYTKEEADKFGVVKENDIVNFHHFHITVPKKFVDTTGKSREAIMGDYSQAKEVFFRTCREIPEETLDLVIDLINQKSILDGETQKAKVENMRLFLRKFMSIAPALRDNWVWANGVNTSSRFKNELIGVLCTELAEGKELNAAVKSWNQRVDPINYMRAVAPVSSKKIEEAEAFIISNDYVEAFDRRHATIKDINVSEILHSNDSDITIKTASLFDGIKGAPSTRHKRSEFDGVQQVPIETFMKEILPTCTSIEAFLIASHEKNLVTLTTANNPKLGKGMFKWDNNFSWTYEGNIAGKSFIKDAVKSRGGNVTGPVRISLAFPDTTDDYDLHVREPNGGYISFSTVRQPHPSSGMLDLDAQGVDGHQPSEKRVENIIYTNINRMPDGRYEVSVNNYSKRNLHSIFSIEIEINGEVTLLKSMSSLNMNTTVGAIIEKTGDVFNVIVPSNMKVVESSTVTKEMYGLESNKFHKVNLVCLSPNFWGENNVGNKHFLFMLDGCANPTPLKSFHCENLCQDLVPHRQALEVLAEKRLLAPVGKQLAGLGFNATVSGEELVLKLKGTHSRVVKIIF